MVMKWVAAEKLPATRVYGPLCQAGNFAEARKKLLDAEKAFERGSTTKAQQVFDTSYVHFIKAAEKELVMATGHAIKKYG